MMKKLMVGAAMGALMISGAMAQAPNTQPGSDAKPPAASTTPPAASQSQTPPAASKNTTAGQSMSSGATAGDMQVITSQQTDQWLSSKFEGTDVVGADDKKIGDVSDILFDQSGKVEAYIVSVGGFLGMGAKEVALAPSSFQVVPGDNGGAPKLRLSMSQDQLKNAQAFTRKDEKATTTGAGSSGTMNRPAGTTAPANR